MKHLRYSEQKIEEEDIAAVVRVMRSPYLTQGPEVEAFEAELAAYCGAKYAVAVSSGTAALQLVFEAQRGRPLSQVLTSPLSFVATANAPMLAGFEVAFYDVEATTGNLVCRDDPPYDIVMPVHYAGRAASIPEGCVVVEDACHALGALDFDGCSRVGSCAHSLASCFSFHAVKPICTGEGGAVTTSDQGLATEIRALRSHGRTPQGEMLSLSGNYRMTEMQAALGRSQLERCDEMRERRCYLASAYYAKLWPSDERLSGHVLLPEDDGEVFACRMSHHLAPVRIKNGKRDSVKAALNAQGIGAQVHYPCIHLQPYYRERFGYKEGDFPEAEAWGREELSLPLHAGMVEADVTRVVDALRVALS